MPSIYEIVTEKIIKQLESGVAPWRKPWTCQTPTNLITQKEYRGLNVFTLASQGFPSRFWLTFNQTTKLGGRIRKGEKSSPVIFWNVGDERETTTQDGTKETSRPFLRRLHGVTLYRETERAFSVGDRVQFTAPNRERHIANRELGTIEKIDGSGNLQLRLDSGRTVAFNIKENPHLDYGYAVTSHSSQGQTADRVLVHVDTEQAGEKLVNRRLAYVAVSRGRYDAQVYTNDKDQLAGQLARDVSHRSAMEPSRESTSPAHEIDPPTTRSQGHEQTRKEGHSISR